MMSCWIKLNSRMRVSKSLKICGGITAFLTISISLTILVLWFTVLKPKQPKLTTQELTLKHIDAELYPWHLNVTLGLLLTVHNPNRATFNYDSTTAYITYHGSPAAEASIQEDTIPARGDHNISTDVVLDVDSLVADASFPADIEAGCLNFTSSTTVHGRAKVLNFFKVKATTYSTCYISVYIFTQNASSLCTSRFKF